jgi:hypothetical protein
MTKPNVRHHSAHPSSKVLANPSVNPKPNPAPVEKATIASPVMNSGAPVTKANAGTNPARTALPVAQNNPSLGGIVSGRDVGLDTVNARVPNPDDADPEEDLDCEDEENPGNYCEENRCPVNPLKVS